MKNKKLACTLALMLCAFDQLAAQTTQTITSRKYCGSGFTENLVPDTLFGCDMAKACEAHDVCYGKCDEGQALAGSDYCKKSEFTWIRIKAKLACDSNLKKDIEVANPRKSQCAALGSIYAAAVTIGGQGPFNGRRIDPIGLKALVEASDSPDEAAAIFRHMAIRSQKGEVDLSKLRSKDELLTFDTVKALNGLSKQKQTYLKNEHQMQQLQERMKQ